MRKFRLLSSRVSFAGIGRSRSVSLNFSRRYRSKTNASAKHSAPEFSPLPRSSTRFTKRSTASRNCGGRSTPLITSSTGSGVRCFDMDGILDATEHAIDLGDAVEHVVKRDRQDAHVGGELLQLAARLAQGGLG